MLFQIKQRIFYCNVLGQEHVRKTDVPGEDANQLFVKILVVKWVIRTWWATSGTCKPSGCAAPLFSKSNTKHARALHDMECLDLCMYLGSRLECLLGVYGPIFGI